MGDCRIELRTEAATAAGLEQLRYFAGLLPGFLHNPGACGKYERKRAARSAAPVNWRFAEGGWLLYPISAAAVGLLAVAHFGTAGSAVAFVDIRGATA